MNYIFMIFILSFLILVHEAGHWAMARFFNIAVEDFSIGYGKAFYQKKIGNTMFHLRVIPLGGYVLLQVEDEVEFFKIPIYQRILFSLAGPFANLLLAFLSYFFLQIFLHSFESFSDLSWWQNLREIFLQTIFSFIQNFSQIFKSIPLIFEHPNKLSGLVGIVSLAGNASFFTWQNLLSFIAFLNLNLAIFNLLPLPVLDGGKVVLAFFEKIHFSFTKRLYIPLSVLSWVFLMGLFIYTTGLDVSRLFA